MQGYFEYIPFELFEIILRHLSGVEVGRLKQISKYFNNYLDNTTAWIIRFRFLFNRSIEDVIFCDNTINWDEEIKRLMMIKKRSQTLLSPTGNSAISTFYLLKNIIACSENDFIVEFDESEPTRLSTYCWEKPVFLFQRGNKHILIGPYAAARSSRTHHAIYEFGSEKALIIYKNLYHSPEYNLKSFNKNLATLYYNGTSTIWDLSIICKHTDEALWNSCTDKKELCNKCAEIMKVKDRYQSAACSRVNEFMVLIPHKDYLRVVYPLDAKTFDIQNDTCQIEVDACTEAYQYKNVPIIANEQLIEIDGAVHHIVHCTVNKQHRFYDLTAKKMMATINCWMIDKWIPNTSYLAMATRDKVIVIDFNERKTVSCFKPKDNRRPDRTVINALHASRSGPVLLIGMGPKYMPGCRPNDYSKDGVVLMYSALTGVRISHLCEIGRPGKFGIELSEDEKTMVLWQNTKVYIYDLGDTLACLQ